MSWRRRTLLGGSALVLALGLGELALRCVPEAPRSGYPNGIFARADEMGYRLTGDFRGDMTIQGRTVPVELERSGYRSPPVVEAPVRLLSLGDSFCFGHGVAEEETYSRLLEQRLGIQVVNMGVPGFNTQNALGLLRRDGPALDPDLVLLGFYVGNDITGNHHDHVGRMVVRSGLLVRFDEERQFEIDARSFAIGNSRLASVLWRTWRRRSLAAESRESRCEALEWDQGFALGVARRNLAPEVVEAYEVSKQVLREFDRFCREELGCPLAVVLLPAPHQYKPATFAAVAKACSLTAEEFETDRPQRELRPFLEGELGVYTLDLLPTFRRASEAGERLHLDVHFNPTGHAVAAEELADFLEARNLVPRTR